VSWNHRIINNRTLIILSILVFFCAIGCSHSYSVPSNSKVIIPKENLTTYNPKNFNKENNGSNKQLKNEDQLIIQAIFLEDEGAYKQSNEFYALLYEATGKEEYLLKELTTAYQAGILSKNLDDLKQYVDKNPEHHQAHRLLLSFYLKSKKFTEAKEVGKALTKTSKEAVDFELAANPYIFTGEYKASLKYLEEAYKKTANEDILLKIVTIQINYLQETNAAIKALEQHRKKEGCSEKICLQLIGIYSQQNQPSKLAPLYKNLYNSTKKEIYFEKIIESYLLNKNLDAAVRYVEKSKSNHDLLYALYIEQKSYIKAHNLAKRLQKETKDPKWYAESAISYYESLSNNNDKKALAKVVKDFEKAIELGEKNPVYLNYYGYTLIDKDLDIKKGLEIIKRALEEEPENTYFLDSLAWGYYKLRNCEKAYPIMKKVVAIEGLKESEIIQHWNAINTKCNQR